MKAKKWLGAVVGLIVIMGCIFGVYELYGYFHPNVRISYRVEENENLYLSLPSYSIEANSLFGYSSKFDEEMKEWWLVTNEMEVRLRTDYEWPVNVSSNVVVEDGKTIITYNGTVGSFGGEVVPIYEEFVLDFEVSDNLP